LYKYIFPETREEENRMKKILALLLALVMVFALTACGQPKGPLLVMGNSDVPVGQYTQKILAYYGLDEEALAKAGKITYGTNVKEVTTQVKEGSVNCGVIYCTDAFSAGMTVVDSATAEMCGHVIYPAPVLNVSANPEAAQAFLDYLTGPEATEVFEAVGFSAMTKEAEAETEPAPEASPEVTPAA
jgi:molybdenum ABC transporter molybdate-binding protein